MKKVVTTRVGADGVLTLTVPLAKTDANKTVRVTVETVEGAAEPATPTMPRDEWLKFIEATAGKWQGELERPPQGEYEERDGWP
jgi:hypothetical protein